MPAASDAAVEWLRAFKGEPSYDAWAAEIVNSLVNARVQGMGGAALYPRPAAQIIATMDAPAADIAARTAIYLTRDEPRETVRWALDLADPEVRSAAVAQTVGAWTIDDPAAARQWVLGLPSGELRDRALTAQFTQEIAAHGAFDRGIVAAFSSQSAREHAMNGHMFEFAFRALGSRDPETAMRLLDNLVDDATLKRDIVAVIDRVRAGGMSINKFSTVSVLP